MQLAQIETWWHPLTPTNSTISALPMGQDLRNSVANGFGQVDGSASLLVVGASNFIGSSSAGDPALILIRPCYLHGRL